MENGWSSSDTIALVSGIVAGLSVLVAGTAIAVNAWLTNRRMGHDEQMQEQRLEQEAELHKRRLDHERRESLRTIASAGYAAAFRIWVEYDPLSLGKSLVTDPALQSLLDDATRDLQIVGAVGWNDDVRRASRKLLISQDNGIAGTRQHAP